MRASPFTILIAASLAGCVATFPVDITLPPGTRAVLLVAFDPAPDRAPAVIATEPTGGQLAFPLTAPDAIDVRVLAYQRSLEELLLQPGVLALSDAMNGEPLPKPAEILAVKRAENEVEVTGGHDLSELEGIFLVRVDRGACLRAGRCYAAVPEGAACVPSCPPPSSVQPPRALGRPEPLRPVAPRFTPCPPGWTEEQNIVGIIDPNARIATCEPPPPTDLVPTCPPDQAQFIGAAGCSRIGPDCPTGQGAAKYGDLPPDRHVEYVDGSAAPGGSGTVASPHATIAAALSAAPAGAVIAIAAGTYPENIRPVRAVDLIGACASGVELQAAGDPMNDVAVDAGVAGPVIVSLSRMKIIGGEAGMLARFAGTEVELTDVIVEGAAGAGLFAVAGALIRATGVLVTGRNVGILAQSGSRIELVGSVLARNVQVGAQAVDEGSSVSITRSIIRDTGDASAEFGFGVLADKMARLEVFESEVRASSTWDAYALDGATLTLADDRLVGSRLLPDSGGLVVNSATASIARTSIEHYRGTGFLAHRRARATVTDLVLRDVHGEPGEPQPLGFGSFSSTVSARRIRIESISGEGLKIVPTSSVTIEDAFIARMSDHDGNAGEAMILGQGARISMTRLLVEEAYNRAVYIGPVIPDDLPPAAIQLVDLTVRDIRRSRTATSGDAIVVSAAAPNIFRALIERYSVRGILISGTPRVNMTNVTIKNPVVPEAADLGQGIVLVFAARAVVVGLEIEEAQSSAIGLFQGSGLEVFDGVVKRMRPGPGGGRIAVKVDENSRLVWARGHFLENDGIMVQAGGPVRLQDVVFEGTGREDEVLDDVALRFDRDGQIYMERVRISSFKKPAIWVLEENTRLTALDLEIRGIRSSDAGRGIGLTVDRRARARVERFLLTDISGVGAKVTAGSELNLEDGVIDVAEIGLELPAGERLDSVLPGVRFGSTPVPIELVSE